MFLHLLSGSHQQLFCRAALSLIHADEVVHEHEQDLRDSLMREMSLTGFPTEVEKIQALAPELQTLANADQGRLVLLELAGVALADGELHTAESKWLRHAASALEISSDELGRFCDFASNVFELGAEGRLLIFEPHAAAAD